MMSNTRRALVAALMIAAAAVPLAAWQHRPLPSFAITAADGTVVDGLTLAGDETWLIVYVQARCAPCDALLAHLNSEPRAAAGRIVIIAGVDPAALAEWSKRYTNLAGSRWFADPEREAMAALGVKAGPTVFGLRKSQIEWRLAGGVKNDRELESILFTWLERQ